MARLRRFLLIYDGNLMSVFSCRLRSGMLYVEDSESPYELPAGAILSTLRLDTDLYLHVAGIERVALLDHAALDRLRLSILQQSIPDFEEQNPLVPLVRFAATLVPLVVSLFLLFRFLDIGQQLQDLAVALQLLERLLREGVPVR